MRAAVAAGLGLCLALAAGAARADPCRAPLPPLRAEFSGPVVWIIDGDSLCVATPDGLVEVRVEHFSAPEYAEPGGAAAFDDLAFLTLARPVTCVGAVYSYDRIVADCRLAAGASIGRYLQQAASHRRAHARTD